MNTNKSTEAAFQFLAERMPSEWDIEHSQYIHILMQFQDTHGDAAVEGLAGFYLHAIRKFKGDESSSNAIASTFAHDLNGRMDQHMLPRSNSYIDVWKEEFNKYNN